MNLFKKIFYIIIGSIFLVSCKKDPLPVLTLSADKIVFSNKTSTETISVSSNYNWSISNDSDWISITPTSSTGESTVKISATENNTDSDRTTNLVVTTGKEGTPSYLRKVISITQSNSVLYIDFDYISFEKVQSSKSLVISSNTDWELIIPANISWITSDILKGFGNGQLNLTVVENTGQDRSVDVEFKYAGKTKIVKIFQKRGVNSPPAPVSPIHPQNNLTNIPRILEFSWEKSVDTDKDQVKYDIELSESANFPEGALTKKFSTDTLTKYSTPELLKENTKYYWRVTASDSYGAKTVSSAFTFTTGTKGGYANGESRVAFFNTNGLIANEIVFVGDGYTIADFVDGGKFDQDMNEGIDAFFSVEPYKSYKQYFRVYKLAAYSKESGATQLDKGIQKETAFSTVFKGGSSMEADDEKVFKFVSDNVEGMEDTNPYYSGIQGKVQNTLIVLVVKEDRYAGTCWMFSDGRALAICPNSRDTRSNYHYKSIVNHEAGGHGFGRLADEYVTSANKDKTITDSEKTSLQNWVKYGFYPNVDLTSDLNNIKWKHFVGKAGYSVAAHEGGFYFTYGVWRPESSSCMIDNRQYYNTPSREHIVKRILRTAHNARISEYVNGVLTPIPNDPYNLDEFVRLDVKKTEAGVQFYTKSFNPLTFNQLAPPVMVEVKY